MIEKIEKLRLEKNISKAELCRLAGISKAQYYNYIKTNNIPYNVVDRIITELGFKLVIIKDIL